MSTARQPGSRGVTTPRTGLPKGNQAPVLHEQVDEESNAPKKGSTKTPSPKKGFKKKPRR